MRTYAIRRSGAPDLLVAYEGDPPCLWCGAPVRASSMDGPLVCDLCDAGLVRDADGTVRPWSPSEFRTREQHRRAAIEEIVRLNDRRGASC